MAARPSVPRGAPAPSSVVGGAARQPSSLVSGTAAGVRDGGTHASSLPGRALLPHGPPPSAGIPCPRARQRRPARARRRPSPSPAGVPVRAAIEPGGTPPPFSLLPRGAMPLLPPSRHGGQQAATSAAEEVEPMPSPSSFFFFLLLGGNPDASFFFFLVGAGAGASAGSASAWGPGPPAGAQGSGGRRRGEPRATCARTGPPLGYLHSWPVAALLSPTSPARPSSGLPRRRTPPPASLDSGGWRRRPARAAGRRQLLGGGRRRGPEGRISRRPGAAASSAGARRVRLAPRQAALRARRCCGRARLAGGRSRAPNLHRGLAAGRVGTELTGGAPLASLSIGGRRGGASHAQSGGAATARRQGHDAAARAEAGRAASGPRWCGATRWSGHGGVGGARCGGAAVAGEEPATQLGSSSAAPSPLCASEALWRRGAEPHPRRPRPLSPPSTTASRSRALLGSTPRRDLGGGQPLPPLRSLPGCAGPCSRDLHARRGAHGQWRDGEQLRGVRTAVLELGLGSNWSRFGGGRHVHGQLGPARLSKSGGEQLRPGGGGAQEQGGSCSRKRGGASASRCGRPGLRLIWRTSARPQA
ncbi:hypothetical protein PVAP13_2NG615101 [Panicum virgatum]|uniref:Uncharacterized protein n=1 Tax=Panicum virgatum TaxID=38727 RepID=A0A8T0VQV4_PANVG|nr:hypothetical protein PVAP13_2NG615101 [Panicum virgatum]